MPKRPALSKKPNSEPLSFQCADTAEADGQVVLHWPDHYAAVGLPDTPRELQAAWEDRGYSFIRFPADTAAWPPLFQRLGRLLGL